LEFAEMFRRFSLRKLLWLLLIALAACSEKNPSDVKSKHSKVLEAKSATNALLIRDKVSPEAKDALLNLYGGGVWVDKNLGGFFKDKTEGYVTPKFEGRFVEGGISKLLVLGYITPEPGEDYQCHECVPLIGGAIFQRQESKWVVESAQKIIGRGDVLETGEFRLIQIGPEKYGVSIHITDAHQGYEDDRFVVLVPYQGNLNVALDAGFIEKPGDAAFTESNVALLKQDLNIKFELGKNSEYFDAVVRARYNDGDSQHWVRKDETKRYQFRDGKFEPI
jgi:hypothetical protein